MTARTTARGVGRRRRDALTSLVVALILTTAATLPSLTASAQEAADGSIRGRIEMGTAEAVLAAGASVELIEL